MVQGGLRGLNIYSAHHHNDENLNKPLSPLPPLFSGVKVLEMKNIRNNFFILEKSQ